MRLARLLAPAVALVALAPATPAAAATSKPRVLPTIERTTSVAVAQKRVCSAAPAAGRGVDSLAWTAPDDGHVAVRLRGSRRSDWDLALFDGVTRTKLDGSSAFGSNEVATTRVKAGQPIRIQTCRRTGRQRSVPLKIDFTAIRETLPTYKLQLVKVEVPTLWDRQRLASLGLDLADHSDGRTQYAVLHSPADATKLTGAGFRYTVEIADVAAQDAADRAAERRAERSGRRRDLPSGRTSYRHYDDYLTDLKAMVDENPGVVRPVTLPVKTLEGRDIVGVEIARDVNRTDDGRPVYVQIGVHHAREWPAGESTIEFGIDLLQRGLAGEAGWVDVLNNARTMIVPIMNADGFIATRTVPTTPNDDLPATPGSPQQIVGGVGYRRKNCRPLSPDEDDVPCEMRQLRDNGVDPNRNYGEQWGGPGTSSNQSSLVYHGEGPFSEPETQSVREWLLKLQPTVLITNHTFTGLILRPPGTSFDGPAPDEDQMRHLGDAMARETDYISQYSYQLYDTSGTTDDWLYGGLGSFSFTPEIGKQNFHPNYTTSFVPEYDGREEIDKDTGEPTGRKLGGLRRAFLLAGLAAIDPTTHSVLKGAAPPGRTLRIQRDFETVTSSRPNDNDVLHPVQRLPEHRESTLTVPSNGQFTWHVAPSTRPFEDEPRPWTLTCEDGAGNVLERRDVYVSRDQQLTLDLACGASSPPGDQPDVAPPTNTATCTDEFRPRTSFRRPSRMTRRRISLQGRSVDQGCRDPLTNLLRAAGLSHVEVAITRAARRGRCRHLRADGSLTRARSCETRKIYLAATGTSTWRLNKTVRLPRGHYKVWVRAVDKAGNTERRDARRNFRRFRLR
jgi:hypothetical protein